MHFSKEMFASGNDQRSQLLEQAEQFKDNHDYHNYSDNIEDVSVHAETSAKVVYARWL